MTKCPKCGQPAVLIDPCPRCSYVKPRDFLLAMMPVGGVCAEIGVWRGNFSKRILSVTQPSKLYLIDPWMFQPSFGDSAFGGTVVKNQTEMDRMHADVADAFRGDGRVEIIRATSEAALDVFADGFLDWVYIDGNHHQEVVKRDLLGYTAKVRTGGFVTGDDYGWGAALGQPVKRAVTEVLRDGLLEVVLVEKNQYVLKRVARCLRS